MPENRLHGGRDGGRRLVESSRSKNRRESGPARTTLIRQGLPGQARSFVATILVFATRLNQRGSARRLARTGRTRTDRRNPCNSRPDGAGPEEAVADDGRREARTWSGITRCDGGRRANEELRTRHYSTRRAPPGRCDRYVSSPNLFGPGVPPKNPHSISTHSHPMIGTKFIRNHQPDLSRSCHRLT